MLSKAKIVTLKGKPLLRLVQQVYDRDNHCCVCCGSWVEDGCKPHHEPCGYGRKSDELGKMVLLCNRCHFERHNGKNAAYIKARIESYLEEHEHEADN